MSCLKRDICGQLYFQDAFDALIIAQTKQWRVFRFLESFTFQQNRGTDSLSLIEGQIDSQF